MARIKETAFSAVCLCFSGCLLVMCMLLSAKCAAEDDRIRSMTSLSRELEQENRILRVRFESAMDLESLEKYALEKLGMQRCSPGQIYYIEYSG